MLSDFGQCAIQRLFNNFLVMGLLATNLVILNFNFFLEILVPTCYQIVKSSLKNNINQK